MDFFLSSGTFRLSNPIGFDSWFVVMETFICIVTARQSNLQLFDYCNCNAAIRQGLRSLFFLFIFSSFQHRRLPTKTSVANGNEENYCCHEVKLTGFFCSHRLACVGRWSSSLSVRMDRDSVLPVAQQISNGVRDGGVTWQERRRNCHRSNSTKVVNKTKQKPARDKLPYKQSKHLVNSHQKCTKVGMNV